jgi:hypothetical protein
MSYSKMNRIGLLATAGVLFVIGLVQGCSSSGDDQAAPTAGTGGKAAGGSGGASTAGGAAGATSSGGMSSAGTPGSSTAGEGGAAGASPGGMCEPAEDHGEALVIKQNGGKLPAL